MFVAGFEFSYYHTIMLPQYHTIILARVTQHLTRTKNSFVDFYRAACSLPYHSHGLMSRFPNITNSLGPQTNRGYSRE